MNDNQKEQNKHLSRSEFEEYIDKLSIREIGNILPDDIKLNEIHLNFHEISCMWDKLCAKIFLLCLYDRWLFPK